MLPAGVGVNIHFVTGHEKDLDLIAAAEDKIGLNERRYPVVKVRGDARRADEYAD